MIARIRAILWRPYKRLLKLLAKHMVGYQLRCQLLRMAGYIVGEDVFIAEDLIIRDELDDKAMVRIGNRVAIADRVTLVVSSTPNWSRIQPLVNSSHGAVEIGDDAWLGTGCIVLPNIRIGRGAVVGAGSVVTKNVADFTVVAGVPARLIRKLDVPEDTLGHQSD